MTLSHCLPAEKQKAFEFQSRNLKFEQVINNKAQQTGEP